MNMKQAADMEKGFAFVTLLTGEIEYEAMLGFAEYDELFGAEPAMPRAAGVPS